MSFFTIDRFLAEKKQQKQQNNFVKLQVPEKKKTPVTSQAVQNPYLSKYDLVVESIPFSDLSWKHEQWSEKQTFCCDYCRVQNNCFRLCIPTRLAIIRDQKHVWREVVGSFCSRTCRIAYLLQFQSGVLAELIPLCSQIDA